MLELISDDERNRFVFDDGTDNKPVFIYKRLKGGISQKIALKHTKNSRNGPVANQDAMWNETITRGLLDWENVLHKGEPVEYDVNLIPHLPTDCKMELASKIAADSEVTEEEEKNS